MKAQDVVARSTSSETDSRKSSRMLAPARFISTLSVPLPRAIAAVSARESIAHLNMACMMRELG